MTLLSVQIKKYGGKPELHIAKDARAVYHVKRIVLVNLDLIDEYLEAFRDEEF